MGAFLEELRALAVASRTVGSPQIRNRGTIGGNLGTASPAGDALPPLLIESADVVVASVRGERRMPLGEFLVGVKRNVLEPDELVVAVRVEPSRARQTFMKIGPRNAMVIARAARRPHAGRGACGVRVLGADRAARHCRPRRARIRPGARRGCGEPDRRCPRNGRLPAARPPCAHRTSARAVPVVTRPGVRR